jgi:acetoin utilization protein AcuB
VGIVTDRDLRQTTASPATSLSVHELHYLLDKLTVAEVMTKPVLTISPDDSVEDAARLLLKHRIGGLPVVRQGELVGILTETDILAAFLDVMGITETSGRVDLVIEDRPEPEAFRDVCRAIAEQGGDIASVVMAKAKYQGRERKVLVFRVEAPDFDALIAHLKAAGYPILAATR